MAMLLYLSIRKRHRYFSRVMWIIDEFNKSRRKIATGVKYTANESMSSIHFWTTQKVNMTHYSFIFMNLDPLG